MMDLESQAVPSSQDPAPVDTPRDGIARVTEDGSPDENRDVGLGGPVPPPAKRARTATAPVRVKSFDGAKQFIAQLREAEAGGGEAEALGGEPGGGETAVEAKDTAPARIHETANGEHDPATENENAPNVSANPANPNPPTLEPVVAAPDKQTSPPRPESNQHQGQGRYPGHGHQATLDEIEEDAIHVLSGLFEDETMSQALSDANTGLASARNGKARRSSVSKPPCSSSGGKSAADKNTWTGVVAARTNAGTTSGNTSSQAFGDLAAGPSGSRKAADHRRLLKSYMKALFRHLKLPVDSKPALAATYRDRINSALTFWFGNSFTPGATTVECNAPKIVAALVYLATFGRVTIPVDAVRMILRKGLNAKNANYTLDEPALRKLGVSVDEMKGLFTGPSRVENGFPRGTPLHLPDLDSLPKPVGAAKSGGKTATVSGGAGELSLDLAKSTPKKNGQSTSLPSTSPREAQQQVASPDEGLGESGGAPAGTKSRSKTVCKTPGVAVKKNGCLNPLVECDAAPVSNGSPLFSPLGGVTAAFAAAALMPQLADRCLAVKEFVETYIAPALAALHKLPAETQLEALNCAQGEFVRRAASLAKESHRAAAADREHQGEGDVPVGRGKRRTRGGKR